MEQARPEFLKYIFVCENQRVDGTCCSPEGALIREALKKGIKAAGLDKKMRVSRSGCLDLCAGGPSVLLMPDNIWFKRVSASDADFIIKKSAEGVQT